MIPLLLITVAACAILFMVYAARGTSPEVRDPQEIQALTTAIDLDAFRNLVSFTEEEYLRSNLLPVEFRRIRRARLFVAFSYVKTAARNAAILIRLAEAGRRSPDPTVVASAADLADTALQMRLHALRAMFRISLAILSPRFQVYSLDAVDGYQALTRSVTHFVSLSGPKYTSTVADSL
jgi:hypothetical protein